MLSVLIFILFLSYQGGSREALVPSLQYNIFLIDGTDFKSVLAKEMLLLCVSQCPNQEGSESKIHPYFVCYALSVVSSEANSLLNSQG